MEALKNVVPSVSSAELWLPLTMFLCVMIVSKQNQTFPAPFFYDVSKKVTWTDKQESALPTTI